MSLWISRSILIVVIFVSAFATAERPTWAKKATGISIECSKGAVRKCGSIQIPSPDGRSRVDIAYREKDGIDWYILRVFAPEMGIGEIKLAEMYHPSDLLWSPDSKAFFVNGSEGGYWGFWVKVFRVDASKLRSVDITHEAQRDMVKSFPPCKATYLDKKTCKAMEANPEYNMSGIDWAGGSSDVVVMGEVPCAGSEGGIMCQVLGYELEVPTGRILKKMNARTFAATWQKSMAWKFEVPDPPDYCDKSSDRTLPPCEGHDW